VLLLREVCFASDEPKGNDCLVQAPQTIETVRLILERPAIKDINEMFTRFASDPEVTRFVGWPRHKSLADTEAFLQFSEAQWNQWPAGPYLVRSRNDGSLLGSTGLAFESLDRASTGYVFARDAWGQGFASEALTAMVALAANLRVRRLEAMCHAAHAASARVLEKAGFTREKIVPEAMIFPNHEVQRPSDLICYAIEPAVFRDLCSPGS
jgi:ribosomal-protein-alanine N-acetyltransferase